MAVSKGVDVSEVVDSGECVKHHAHRVFCNSKSLVQLKNKWYTFKTEHHITLVFIISIHKTILHFILVVGVLAVSRELDYSMYNLVV